MSSKLSDDIRELLTHRVDSFEKLELIVALHGAPRATLSMDALIARLELPRDLLREAVAELHSASLVDITSTGEVQLRPPTSRDHAAVEQLIRAYHEDRLTLVQQMSEISLERIRTMASRLFGDAFGGKRTPRGDGDGD